MAEPGRMDLLGVLAELATQARQTHDEVSEATDGTCCKLCPVHHHNISDRRLIHLDDAIRVAESAIVAGAAVRPRNLEPAEQRLIAAIRRITVDAKDAAGNDVPNGPAEVAFLRLTDALHRVTDLDGDGYVLNRVRREIAEAAAAWCEAYADDCKELREAAEGFFGGDFRAPETEVEPPYVCPGCYAVGGAACAPGCIDAEIAAENAAREDTGYEDEARDDEQVPT